MKVVRILARLNIGGPSIHVTLVNQELQKRGHQCLLLTGDVESGEGNMEYLADSLGVTVTKIPDLGRRISASRDQKAFREIYRILKREKPDVVHTHTAKAGALGRSAALLAGVPCVVHTFHGNVLDGYFSRTKSAVFCNIERALAKLTDRVITITPQQCEKLCHFYRIASPGKIETIRLGFDLERWRGLAEHRSLGPANAIEVGWIGRLTPIKDPIFLVSTAGMLPQIHFNIVGDGEMRPQVESYIKKNNVHNLDLRGWCSDMSGIYRDLDLVVLTSLNEGTPVALIEAMACGLPFVSTDVGGLCDLVIGQPEHKEGFDVYTNGILVPGRDSKTLASAIQWLADRPALRLQMGIIGNEFVNRTYGKSRLVDELERLYGTILRSKGKDANVSRDVAASAALGH